MSITDTPTDAPAATTTPPAPFLNRRAEAAQRRRDARRDYAVAQAADLLRREPDYAPRVWDAEHLGTCGSCELEIRVGDLLADALRYAAHFACSVCAICGEWTTSPFDSTPLPQKVGRVHDRCQGTTTVEGDAR